MRTEQQILNELHGSGQWLTVEQILETVSRSFVANTIPVVAGQSIQAANDRAVAAGMTAANPYTILVYPGVYTEQVILAEGAHVVGIDRDGCIINRTSTADLDFVLRLDSHSSIRNLTVGQGALAGATATGTMAVTVTPTATDVDIDGCRIQGGDWGVFLPGDVANGGITHVRVNRCLFSQPNPIYFQYVDHCNATYNECDYTGRAKQCVGFADIIGNNCEIAYNKCRIIHNADVVGSLIQSYALQIQTYAADVTPTWGGNNNISYNDIDMTTVRENASAFELLCKDDMNAVEETGSNRFTKNTVRVKSTHATPAAMNVIIGAGAIFGGAVPDLRVLGNDVELLYDNVPAAVYGVNDTGAPAANLIYDKRSRSGYTTETAGGVFVKTLADTGW